MTLTSTYSDLLSAPRAEEERSQTGLVFYSRTLTHFYEVANAAFAGGVPAGPAERLDIGEGRRTPSSTTADPEVVASTADAPALRALEQLRGWLNLSYEQLGVATGLSPSVIHYWRRRHRENQPIRPRASSVEQLWRVHSAFRAISEALDGDDSGYGVQMWARSAAGDAPSPLDLLMRGHIDAVEKRAGALLFDQTSRRPSSWQLVGPEGESELEPTGDVPPVDYGEADFG